MSDMKTKDKQDRFASGNKMCLTFYSLLLFVLLKQHI